MDDQVKAAYSLFQPKELELYGEGKCPTVYILWLSYMSMIKTCNVQFSAFVKYPGVNEFLNNLLVSR